MGGWAFRCLADLLVGVHTLFVLFVVCGGIAVWRWRWLVWAHIPAVLWGVAVEYNGWICPLTPWENALRARAGAGGYAGGFVEHYLIPVLYPSGLTAARQVLLGSAALGANLLVYGLYVGRRWVRAGPTPRER